MDKPDESKLEFYKAIELFKVGKNEEGSKCIDKAIVNRLIKKGKNLEKLGRYKEAIKCYDEALEFNLDNNKCQKNKSRALENLEKYKEAKRFSEIKLTNRGTLPDVYKKLPKSNYKDDT